MKIKPDYDLVIIGGGPAGLTAGIYAMRAKLNCILIEKKIPGGLALITDWVENYPGFPEGISGADLTDKFIEQAKRFGLKIENEAAEAIWLDDGLKKIKTDQRLITAASVIITAGTSPKKLGIEGETLFYGKGVSTCATCDGFFYRDKIVAAIGGGDSAVQESLFLTKFVKKVWLIHRRDSLRAAKILQERAFKNDKIEILWDCIPKKISGRNAVEELTIQNVKTEEIKDLSIDGCFIFAGTNPNTGFLGDLVKTDENGFVYTDNNMGTSVKGLFCAGDARKTPLRQIVTATGDAAIAVAGAEKYIENFYEK
ncbi:MAG: thioredoxin-disulfide reductase [Deltaproteobacteria bacterium]|nr:thioredoxin-disulfide reductase [Deltaproteobacteria bacterium]